MRALPTGKSGAVRIGSSVCSYRLRAWKWVGERQACQVGAQQLKTKICGKGIFGREFARIPKIREKKQWRLC
jgi:hypothetical protein